MSGETEKEVSGWTVDTLHTHLAARIDNLEKRLAERADSDLQAVGDAFLAHEKLTNVQIDAASKAVTTALSSAEKAVSKAETANEKRFESVNEFRQTLSDQATLFMPRTEYAANHANLANRVSELTDRLNRSEGKGVGLNAGWVYALGALAALGTIVSLFLVFSGAK